MPNEKLIDTDGVNNVDLPDLPNQDYDDKQKYADFKKYEKTVFAYQNDLIKTTSNDYPYWRIGGRKFIDKFKKAIAPFNPLAEPMVPSYKRDAAAARYGSGYYAPHPYPNPTLYTNLFPRHHDPLKETSYTHPDYLFQGAAPVGDYLSEHSEMIPIGCARATFMFDRCALINGKEKCRDEGNKILGICPTFVLDHFHKFKLQNEVIKTVQINELQQALAVSDYNKGRTLADIDQNKNFFDGTRRRLRPDTLWADDRYVDVSTDEIEAAKKRVEEAKKNNPLFYNKFAKLRGTQDPVHHGHDDHHDHNDHHNKHDKAHH